MKKYRTCKYDNTITEIECVRETAKRVVIIEERGWPRKPVEIMAHRTSEYHSYHDTWEAAHYYLVARAEIRLENARRELQDAQSKLGNINGMKPPVAA